MDEIKKLKNNLPNTLVKGETTIDCQLAVVVEYQDHVNDDGSLSVAAENQDN